MTHQADPNKRRLTRSEAVEVLSERLRRRETEKALFGLPVIEAPEEQE